MRGNRRHSRALGSVWAYRLLRGVKECCVLYIFWAQLHLWDDPVRRQTYRTDLWEAVCTLVAWGAGMETAYWACNGAHYTFTSCPNTLCNKICCTLFCRQVWTEEKRNSEIKGWRNIDRDICREVVIQGLKWDCMTALQPSKLMEKSNMLH